MQSFAVARLFRVGELLSYRMDKREVLPWSLSPIRESCSLHKSLSHQPSERDPSTSARRTCTNGRRAYHQ